LTSVSRPVKPRASRIALIVASVPEDTRRTISMLGTRATSSSASSISASVGAPKVSPRAAASCTARTVSGSAWPRISGPHEPT